ncbi:MAG TPA: YIP1 family protein [Gemmatimonadales bacterium]|jgi:hypothetical protein|nr:YIP1 family protein [Gemmatimonadales bacterium]
MSETAPAPAPAPATSRWEDFIDIFISPAELFRRRADGRFGHALLMLVVLSAALYFGTRTAMQPVMDAEFARSSALAMKNTPGMTPERLESFRAMTTRIAPIFVIVGLPLAIFVLGAIVWLAARMVGGRVNYAQGATIMSFAFFPKLIEGISSAVQALLLDEAKITSRFSVSLGIGRFLDPAQTNPLLFALLGRVDLFTLWVTALIAVGFKQMGKLSTGQAVAGAAIVWLIGALPALLQALRAG